jgi:Flp pilus assembly protein TadD/septal ring factor EnvC (AmiA/AmiB activator)
MKQLLLLFLLGALGVAVGPRAVATDTGDQFLEAYFAIQQADAAEQAGNLARAEAKFTSAVATLNEIKAAAPDWNPRTVEYRLAYCANHLARLQKQRGAAPTTAAPLVVDADKVRQLTEELTQARQQIRHLEEAREQLNVRLQEATAKVAPEATPAPTEPLKKQDRELTAEDVARGVGAQRVVQELLKQNKELAVQLAARQAELTEARQSATPVAPVSKDLAATREELTRTKADLEKVRQLLTSTQSDLRQSKEENGQLHASYDKVAGQLSDLQTGFEKTKTENTKLRASYDQVVAQLTDANRKLDAAVTASRKDAEIITQLRKEAAMPRIVSARPAVPAAPPQEQPAKKSWWPFGHDEPKKETPTAEPAVKVQTTETGKLVAELQSPTPAPAEKPETDVKKLVSEGRAALDKGDLETAESKLAAAVAASPDNVPALNALGGVYCRRGDLDRAETTMQKAVRLAPDDSAAKSLLGVIYFRRGKLDDAFGELTRAIALDPRNAEAHNYLGITLTEKGWATAAETEIQRAVELNPKYADAHFNLAVIYARGKTPRLDQARHHYEKSLSCGGGRDAQLEVLIGWKK